MRLPISEQYWLASYPAPFSSYHSVESNYEGRPINKLQNGIILLIFKI